MIAINWLIGHVKLHAGSPSEEPQQQSVSQLEQDRHGTVSYVSPLARAVVTYGPGDTVKIADWTAVILDVQ